MGDLGQVIEGRLFIIARDEVPVDETKGYLSRVEQRVSRMPTDNLFDPTDKSSADVVGQMPEWERAESGFFEMRNITRAPVAYLQNKEVSIFSKILAFTLKTLGTGAFELGCNVAALAVTIAVALPFVAICSIFLEGAKEPLKDMPSRIVFHFKEIFRSFLQLIPVAGPFLAKGYDMGVMILSDLVFGEKIVDETKSGYTERVKDLAKFRAILNKGFATEKEKEFLQAKIDQRLFRTVVPPNESAQLEGLSGRPDLFTRIARRQANKLLLLPVDEVVDGMVKHRKGSPTNQDIEFIQLNWHQFTEDQRKKIELVVGG